MIREICKQDRDIFIKMAKEFYSSPAVLHNIPGEYIERTFDEITSDSPYAKGYMICSDGQTAGYALVSLTYSNEAGGMVLWIEEMYIYEEFRGSGLGSDTFSALEREYSGKVARIRLEVEEENQKAIKLYKNIGYEMLDYLQMIKENL